MECIWFKIDHLSWTPFSKWVSNEVEDQVWYQIAVEQDGGRNLVQDQLVDEAEGL